MLGQVPPPYHGQAVMVDTLLRGTYPSVELVHVDASYSTALDQLGTPSVDKVRRMAAVIARTLRARRHEDADVLYYHPAGANRSAVIRDIVVLSVLRPFFPVTIFHHHARGLIAAIASLPRPLRALARRSYRAADVAIAPSQALLDEAMALGPIRTALIPNGTSGGPPRRTREVRPLPRVLFLNLISQAKGAHWLLDSIGVLHRRGIPVEAVFAGQFPSVDEEAAFAARIRSLGVESHVQLPGLVVGDAKWAVMDEADVFCVPTTYEQESFGLAMVEAASRGLPIVTTDVAGVREVFQHGESALLADPGDPSSLADLLATVCSDDALRSRLGQNARRLFEERYTEDRFWTALETLFAEVGHAVTARDGAAR